MNTYHKRFLESFCSENMIGLFSRYKGAAKEITESFGMLEAAKAYVPDLGSKLVIVIGDGRSPRTGAMFAYFTKAEVISIDPDLNEKHWQEHCDKQERMGFPVQRLKAYKCKIEDVVVDCEGKQPVLVWPHSHAPMDKVDLRNAGGDRIDIALPCCTQVPAEFMRRPHISYDDKNIESPKRTIRIWSASEPSPWLDVAIKTEIDKRLPPPSKTIGDGTLVWSKVETLPDTIGNRPRFPTPCSMYYVKDGKIHAL